VAVIMAVPATAFMANWKRWSLKCARAGWSLNVCQGSDLGISCAMLNWAAHHPHLITGCATCWRHASQSRGGRPSEGLCLREVPFNTRSVTLAAQLILEDGQLRGG
jgi:hypothetical protein